MDEIYEYNGKQYTYAQLQEKYGDKVNDAISKFGFKQVETFSYNNKNFTRKQLEEKYGERTDEAIEKFGITSNLKKKVGGDATSSDTSSVSGQEAENGSVATPKDTKPNLVKDIDAGKYDDRIDELQAENQEAGAEQSKKEKEYSIPKEMLRSFEKGSARLGQMVGAIPEFLYDIFAIPQNAVADSFGIESLNADSEKFKDYVGIENAIKDHYTGHIDRITKEQEEKDKPIFGDITSNIKQGSYSNAFRLIGKSVSESLPSTIGIALSGGSASAPQVLGGVTTVFGAAANEEYKTENPNMNANERTIKSFGKGLAEGVFSTIGSSKIGVAAKEIIKQEGKEQGAKILKAQLTDMYTELLKKYSIPAAMVGEGIEEAATQMTQNAIDGKPIMDGVSDSFIVGAASGGAFGTALEGVKKISGAKTSPKDIENVEATKDKETSIKYELEQQVKEGDLKPSEAKEIYKNWEEIKNDLKAVPDDFSTEQKSKAVNLIKEKKSIENEIEGKEPALVEDKKARIEEINNELKSIQSKPNQESKPNNNAVSEEITPKSEPNNQINAESEKTTQETPEQPVETPTPETEVKSKEVGVEDTPAPTVKLNPENTGRNNEWKEKDKVELNDIIVDELSEPILDQIEQSKKDGKNTFIKSINGSNEKGTSVELRVVTNDAAETHTVFIKNKTNETTPTKNTEPNGNVQPGVDPSVQQGEDNQVQNPNDPATDKTKTGAPKTYQLGKTETSPKYTATFNNGVLDIKDSEGNTPTPPTRRKVETKYAQDFDFTQGDTASITPDVTDPETFIANNSNNPAEIANQLSVIKTKAYIDNQIDYKTKVIADNIGRKIERQSYVDFGDANKIGKAMANAYFPEKGTGRSIDTLAQELSEDYGIEITPQDIVEHMETYTGGQNDVYKAVRDEKIKPLQDRFTQLTGLPANDKYINMAVQQAIAKEKLNEKLEKDYLDLLTEEELVSLHEDSLEYEKFKQENTETNTGNASVAKTTNTKDGKKTSGVREKDDSPDGGEKGEVERAEANNTSEIEFVQSKLKDKNAPEDQKPFWEDDLRDLKNNPKRYWDAFDLQSIKNTSDNKDRYEQIKFMQEYYGGDTNASSTEQASQSRVKTLTNERINPSVQKPKNPPKKLNTIINEVADKLKATLVYGKSKRRGTAGTYNSSNTLVKIRNAGDLDTVAHELGHLIDDRYDIVGNTKVHPNEIKLVKQLKWFSDRGGSNPPSGLKSKQKAEYLEREGLAEFIRAYIANPKEAKVVAPELYKHFESSIDAKTKSALKEFSQDFLDFANATYGEQILSNVENSTLPGKNKFKDWIDQFKREDGKLNIHWLDKVKSNWTNSMHIANKAFAFVQGLKGNDVKSLKPEENFEVMSRLLAGINGKINHVIGNGLVDAKNNVIKDSKGLTMNINYLLESLDNTSETTLKNEMDAVIKLLIAERTVEYVKKFGRTDNLTGIGGGIKTDLEVAQGHLNELDALKKENKEQYQRIKEAARRYREFADAGLKYAVEKGRISKEQYQRIKDTNEYYVSLARTKEVTPTDEILPFLNESSKISSVKEVIKKAKGGTDVIKNPYLSLLHNTVNFIKEADRNEVMLSFVEPLNEVRKMGDGTPIDLSQIARQVPSGEKNTIKVFKDGELQNWQFDQDIYDALKGIEGISHNKFIEVLGKPAELIRFTVTNFPVFALRNAFRDTMSRMVISRTRGKVSDLLHNKEDRQFFELYGGSQAGFYLTNKDAYAEEMSKAVKAITKKGGIILDPRKLNYTAYRKLLERGENLNRVAEYKSAYRKAKKQGMDDYNAGLYAAYQARDLMDFSVAGHYMRVVNKLVPFSNASVQSIKRSVKGAKEDPAKFALRMALFTVLPQLAFRAMVHANGDDEEYEELPDYQRDLFWNFKTPFTGNTWISLPKPFELGLPSSIIDRGISKANGNNEAFDGATMSSFKTLFPFDETALVGSLKPIIEASSNHDFFRDRDIVPFWEKDKIMALRDGTKYASRIGNALSDGFGFVGAEVDPRKIDHIIKGYTTYYGDWVLSLGDIGKEDSRYQFNVTKTGFAKDMPISNSKSVKKVYDLAKSIGADTNKNVKELKGMVKLYYDLEDKKAKKKLSKAIYKQARLLIPYLEAEKKMKLAKNKLKTTD